MLYAAILSAGSSERMGGMPKPLLKINDRNFIEHIVFEISRLPDIKRIYVVLGFKSDEVIKNITIEKSNVEILVNKNWPNGQLSSLRSAIQHLPEEAGGLLFTLVDHPLVMFETYRTLSEVHKKHPEKIIIPTFRGRKGHPAVFPARVFKILLKEELPGGARELIKREGKNVVFVPVDDEGVIIDIDTHEDYERYISGKAF